MKSLFTFLGVILIINVLSAQSPEEISYQAVIRNSSNKLVTNKQVGMRISILQGSATGTAVYTETQTPTTNANGLVSIAIGTGASTNNFSTIDWSAGPYFIKTETDPNGGINYTITGTSQLLSVPYALYAKMAENGANGSNLDNIKTSPNIKIGPGAGMNTPDFKHDLAIGDSALFFNGQIPPTNTQSDMNTAIGSKTLYENTKGSGNTAIGFRTLQSNTTGNNNTASGLAALYLNTTGARNTACGDSALYSNTSGINNNAIGNKTLYSNTMGYENIAIGNKTLYSNTTGYDNVATGNSALYFNSTGYANTADGFGALDLDTTGYDNTAMGAESLVLNSNGTQNTATGFYSLFQNNTGNYNTADGVYAMYNNGSGSYNTAIGYSAGPTAGKANLSNTGAFGNGAQVTASNTIQIGNSSITQIGGYVAWSNLSDGRFKTNIKANVPGLDFIMKLRPVTFSWNMDKLDAFKGVNDSNYTPEMLKARKEKETKVYTGFIAQEVEKAADSCNYDFSGVIKPANDKTPYNLSYAEFVVPLVKAVQEQEKTIQTLQKENEAMKKDIKMLKAALNK